jgi:hypothetical protein
MVGGFTPGPWKVWAHPNPGFGCEIRMAEPPTVETVTIAEHVTPADAALIAAAPDLLEALTQLRAFIRDGWGGAVRLQSDSLVADVYADGLFRRVDAALAKAEGAEAPE